MAHKGLKGPSKQVHKVLKELLVPKEPRVDKVPLQIVD